MGQPPHKSPQSPLNRSRSSSYSSPVRNRILYQEFYSIGPSTLVRSYSCDQVFDKDKSGRPFQTTQIHVSSFITPEKKIYVNHVKDERKKPRLLAVEFPSVKPDEKDKFKIKKASALRDAIKKTTIFTLLTVASVCAFYYYLSYRECSYTWDLEKTEIELKKNVLGQDQAIARINLVLKKFISTNDVYIMVFTGGVGVGKTYSSSIISKNFPWSLNKLVYYSEYFSTDLEKLLNQKLSTCGCNLVIVDDLSPNSTKEAINLIMLLNNRREKNENLLYILIFKTLTDAEEREIVAEFANAYLNIYHVPFRPLLEDVVEMCYVSEIQKQKVEMTKSELLRLVEHKMKYIDVVRGTSGCKGVSEDIVSYSNKKLK